ncbi:hypothetical protein ABPG72_011647 [Tetrahymena utriculariae]
MNDEEIFKYFDKQNKFYLTKHEFKVSLIYKFGYKFPYDEIKNIWKGRFKFEQSRNDYDSLYDKSIASKGISFKYFTYLINLLDAQISSDKKSTIDFQIIDEDDKGYITFDDFKQLIVKHNLKFIQPSQVKEVYKEMDFDGDEKVSLSDFRKFVKEYKELQQVKSID